MRTFWRIDTRTDQARLSRPSIDKQVVLNSLDLAMVQMSAGVLGDRDQRFTMLSVQRTRLKTLFLPDVSCQDVRRSARAPLQAHRLR